MPATDDELPSICHPSSNKLPHLPTARNVFIPSPCAPNERARWLPFFLIRCLTRVPQLFPGVKFSSILPIASRVPKFSSNLSLIYPHSSFGPLFHPGKTENSLLKMGALFPPSRHVFVPRTSILMGTTTTGLLGGRINYVFFPVRTSWVHSPTRLNLWVLGRAEAAAGTWNGTSRRRRKKASRDVGRSEFPSFV